MKSAPHSLNYAEKWGEFSKKYKGRAFLSEMAKMLAQSTGVCYVLVGYPETDDMSTMRAAVLLANGKEVQNYSYPLLGTPCENVVGRSCCYYPFNIQQMFPNDHELRELGIESYIGLPVQGADGKALGLIALMDTKLIQNPAMIEEGLKVLTARVSKELSRKLKKETAAAA